MKAYASYVSMALVALAIIVAGAIYIRGGGLEGGARPAASSPPDPKRTITLHAPCVISAPIQRVAAAYHPTRTPVDIETDTDKPLAMLEKVSGKLQGAHLVITMGEVEMNHLVRAGTVDPAEVVRLGRNGYQLAVIVPAKADGITKLADLAGPAVKRIAIEDPKVSTLGDRAKESLAKLGLWDKLSPKVVQPDPHVNLLTQLREGKADAVVVYQDCLTSEGGSAPKTAKIIGTLSADSYQPITYEAAPIRQLHHSETMAGFLQFLTSEDGRQALRDAGMVKTAS